MTIEYQEDLQWVIDTINKNKNTKVGNAFMISFSNIRYSNNSTSLYSQNYKNTEYGWIESMAKLLSSKPIAICIRTRCL